jgi:hypothetical protein
MSSGKVLGGFRKIADTIKERGSCLLVKAGSSYSANRLLQVYVAVLDFRQKCLI